MILNIRLKIILLLCFVFTNMLIFALTEINGRQRIKLAINANLQDLQTQFEVINRFHEIDARSIYLSTQSNQKVQEILLQLKDADKKKKDILRVELLNQLKQKYEYLRFRGVYQYHFVMPDNTTFLRMHNPEKYDDYLGEVRYSFYNTNKTHKPTIGFERGKTAHAFRNTYPVFDKDGNYLCALDIGYGSEVIQDHLTQVSHLHTHFLVHKNVLSARIWKRKWLNLDYIQSIENENYLFAITKEHSEAKLKRTNQFLTEAHKKDIKEKMNSGKSFGIYFLQDKESMIVSFVPILNIRDKKVVSYLVSYKPSKFIDSTLLFINIVRSVFLLLLLVLFYFIYENELAIIKERDFSFELERKVEKRTYELGIQKREAEEAHEKIDIRNKELNEALSKVKLLSGIIPICASCKKIRDDDGYWNQVEAYIRDRSMAEFSHGICPECKKKLYPEFCDNEVDEQK